MRKIQSGERHSEKENRRTDWFSVFTTWLLGISFLGHFDLFPGLDCKVSEEGILSVGVFLYLLNVLLRVDTQYRLLRRINNLCL